MDESKQEVKQDNIKVIKISKRKFKVTIIVIVVVILILGFLSVMLGSLSSARYKSSSSFGVSNYENAMPMMQDSDYYRDQESSISDTREFLKTNYSGDIKTRNVKKVVTDIYNIVKGSDGRVDNFRSSEKSGYIKFVVAKSKFDSFRNEIEGMTNAKLYTETINSENLLSQKQGIEQQGQDIVNSLVTYTDQKNNLNIKHKETIASINNEINSIKLQLQAIRINIADTTDEQIIISLRNQEITLMNRDVILRQKLNTENSNFAIQDKNLLDLINNENSNLSNNNKQDNKLLENVETVNGSVYVNFVSIWEIATIFSPISPVLIIIILIIIVMIILKRKGKIPKVVLE